MEIEKLTTRTRNGTGKSYTRKARAQGWIPAIFYGKSTSPVSIEVDKREFSTLARNKRLTHLIDLGIGNKNEGSIAVIKETQKHVIKDDFYYHIDFQHVAMDEKVTVHCPVVIIGLPIGVKDENGVLGHPVKNVMVECLPMEIPEKIEIDVSNLHVGDSIHIRDISVPTITIKDSPDEVVAVVTHGSRETQDTTTSESPEGTTAAEPATPTTPSSAKK